MADPIGGQSLVQSGGGGMPIGQNPNPTQDIAATAMQGGPTLANYYNAQGPQGGNAYYDTSGRAYFGAGPGQAQSLAGNKAAVAAGLIGSADQGPIPGAVPGAVPPPDTLASTGVTPPGPGQTGDASAAQSTAQQTGQAGQGPASGASVAPQGVIGPNGQYTAPSGYVQVGNQNGVSVFRGPDGTSLYTVDPGTGAMSPYLGSEQGLNNQGGQSPQNLQQPSLAQGPGPIAPPPAAPPAPVAPAPSTTPTALPAGLTEVAPGTAYDASGRLWTQQAGQWVLSTGSSASPGGLGSTGGGAPGGPAGGPAGDGAADGAAGGPGDGGAAGDGDGGDGAGGAF